LPKIHWIYELMWREETFWKLYPCPRDSLKNVPF
jgi:hypothetical protein